MANRKILGKDLRIKVDDNTLLHATDCSYSSTLNTESIATKDTAGEEVSPGSITWSLSTTTLVVYRDTGTQNDTFGIMEKFLAKGLVDVEFTTDVANDILITGQGYITQCDISAPTNGNATVNVTITGNGDITLDRVTS